jgi:hypothetical protein
MRALIAAPTTAATAAAIAATALLAAGCFKVDAANGKLKCNPDATRACPAGYHCALDGTCWRNGDDPTNDLGIDDLSVADLTSIGDAGAAKHRGDPCSPGDTCETGFCIDGYCCDSNCALLVCTACNLPGLQGTCSAVPAGMAPVHSACIPQDVSTCGRDGLCDGAGTCELWPASTVCAAGGCTNGKVTGPSRCNGSGTCVAAATVDCDPYICNPAGGVCYDSCTDNTQCLTPNPCNTAVTPGSCGPKSLGGTCLAGTDCKSGNCVDGLCCDMPQSMCNGCKACNVTGSEGHCTNVPNATDPHSACAAVVCADKCDGSGACRPASNTTVCNIASCANTSDTLGQFQYAMATVTKCSGTAAGACNGTSSYTNSGSYTCANATAFKSSCNVDTDCTASGYCNAAHSCVQKINYGQPCGSDTQCLSRICVAGTCRECRTSGDCEGTGICSANTCVSCSNGSDCSNAGHGTLCVFSLGSNVCECTASNQCTDGRTDSCNSSQGFCVCGTSPSASSCQWGQLCVSGVCKNGAGYPCVTAGDCASGVCTANICG